MKICSKCKIEKELSEFDFQQNTKDNLSSYCKTCLIEYRKLYYFKNKEKNLIKSKKCY
jgi:hypothetical protein